MIQATELRIGNIITNKGHDYIVSWTLLRDMELETPSSKFYDGIPLTEEWFLKFGFETKSSYFVKDGEYRFTVGLEKVYVQVGPDDLGCFLTEIKYVHQLQNLYLALTGTELTI